MSNSTLTQVVAIAAGARHALALRADGSIFAWGDDAAGQVSGVNGFVGGVTAIAAGAKHSVLLRGDGTVRVLGSVAAGQSSPPVALGPAYHVGTGDVHSRLHSRRMCADGQQSVSRSCGEPARTAGSCRPSRAAHGIFD